ncbi:MULTISPECIES: hypothetical protein [unclassified Roseofilum]|uniref:hypothetical protein n=1 Tax=unclassified Roseofilum TaxID=2620099 RepID=UPI001B1BB248|nr:MULTISPECIES: hypothetical protein [unclassified Roseofilum]MBP0007516.1 hypothetical protein [Roseofilum sp. Belize Diploria]MBP0031794.1 hypothetical protein [Roseofilum sp. Belize BBD 4]
MLVPPVKDLKALLMIVRQADTNEICHKIGTWDSRYQEFALPILALAEEFKIEAIEEFLQQYLD